MPYPSRLQWIIIWTTATVSSAFLLSHLSSAALICMMFGGLLTWKASQWTEEHARSWIRQVRIKWLSRFWKILLSLAGIWVLGVGIVLVVENSKQERSKLETNARRAAQMAADLARWTKLELSLPIKGRLVQNDNDVLVVTRAGTYRMKPEHLGLGLVGAAADQVLVSSRSGDGALYFWSSMFAVDASDEPADMRALMNKAAGNSSTLHAGPLTLQSIQVEHIQALKNR